MTDAPFEKFSKQSFLDWLRPLQDPEMHLGLVDLGLIYDVVYSNGTCQVTMTLTSPGCPAADQLVNDVKNRLKEYPEVKEVNVTLVFDPKWDPRTMASDEVKDRMGIW